VEDILVENDECRMPHDKPPSDHSSFVIGHSSFAHSVLGVRVRGDAIYSARAVVLTTGTFLQALMHTGETKTPGGRAGEGTTSGISSALTRLGFQLERFKTGTPPRLNGRTIDYGQVELQPG